MHTVHTDRSLSGRDILITLGALVLLMAVVLIVITTALNGFLERFSRDSLRAIAVLLVYAIALAFPLGVLVGYAWCTSRLHRLTLPPAAPASPRQMDRSYFEPAPSQTAPRLPDQPRVYSAAEEQRLMKIMEDLDG